MKSAIIIPALNEEDAIGQVVANVRHKADRVIVVDNVVAPLVQRQECALFHTRMI